jgi:hypothetical protein
VLSPMMILAMPKVCAGVNLSSPGIATGCSFEINSICGGRPGEKIRSLTLSDTANICWRTLARFSDAGVETVASAALVSKVVLIRVLVSEPGEMATGAFTFFQRLRNGASQVK